MQYMAIVYAMKPSLELQCPVNYSTIGRWKINVVSQSAQPYPVQGEGEGEDTEKESH